MYIEFIKVNTLTVYTGLTASIILYTYCKRGNYVTEYARLLTQYFILKGQLNSGSYTIDVLWHSEVLVIFP